MQSGLDEGLLIKIDYGKEKYVLLTCQNMKL